MKFKNMLIEFNKLPPTLVISPITCFSKKRLFEEIAECAGFILDLPTEDVISALNSREKLGSTVCGKSVAIPHTIITSAPKDFKTFGILCLLTDAVAFNTVDTDAQTIDIAYAVFISPDDNYDTTQTLLYEISNILKNDTLTNSLRLSHHDNDKITAILNKVDNLLQVAIKKEDHDDRYIASDMEL